MLTTPGVFFWNLREVFKQCYFKTTAATLAVLKKGALPFPIYALEAEKKIECFSTLFQLLVFPVYYLCFIY